MLTSLRLSAKAFLPLLLAATLFSACSNGGSESDDLQLEPMPTITVSDLRFSQEYYEGEVVTLSLNAEGEAASRLSYHWKVSDGVEFQGQNSDTITFIAPQVTGQQVVNVEVEMTLDNGDGRLLGNSRRSASVRVLDTDPPSILAQGFQTDLPEVEALDLSLLADAPVLSFNVFDQNTVRLGGEPIEVQRVSRITALAQSSDTGLDNVRLCGELNTLQLSQFSSPLATGPAECASGLSLKYYQEGASVRVEAYCNNTVVYAHNLDAVTSDIRAVQGLVTFSQDDFETLVDSSQACMTKTNSLASQYNDAIASPMKYEVAESTRFTIELDQPEGPLVLDLVAGKRIGAFGLIIFSHVFERDQNNSATLFAPAHPQLDGLDANSGSYTVRNLSQGEYTIDFDLIFQAENSPSARIKADSVLYLP